MILVFQIIFGIVAGVVLAFFVVIAALLFIAGESDRDIDLMIEREERIRRNNREHA